MRTVKPDTARSYISTIRSVHIEKGVPSITFDDPRIDLVIRGGKRMYGEGIKRIRLPLTASILLRIISQLRVTEEDINIKAALCVAFAAFLRCGEFTWNYWSNTHHLSFLARQHVKFNADNSVTLTLPSSKADPYRVGVQIQLASTSSPLCPVKALTKLFSLFPRSRHDPLFSRTRHRPFSKKFVVQTIHRLLLQTGIPTRGFSGHSLRKGAAVTAAAAGMSREEIKLLGRWKSDAVDVYINELSKSDTTRKLLLLNSKLQTFL
jgi:hypothetical protein